MDHYEKIYTSRAEEYHQMITPEDAEGNLLPTFQKFTRFENTILLDLGSGTGRIPLLVHDLVDQVIALDLNYPMLFEQRKQQRNSCGSWPLVQGDNRTLPFPDNWADIVTAGWSIGHLCSWFVDDWQTQIGADKEQYRGP